MLTFRGAQVLGRVEKMMEDASRALPPATGAAAALTPPVDTRPGPFAQAGDRKSE
jgi:hypothetical protein